MALGQSTIEALQKRVEELEDLYNNAPVGCHSLDKDGVFIRINDTELSWIGYAREEIVGKKKLPDLLSPASLKIFQEHFPDFKERGLVRDLELELLRKDGTVLPVLISATAIKDPGGNFLMSRSILYNLTERKRVERALRTLSRCNEALVRASDENELLREMCQAIVETGGYRMSWVGFAEHDNEKTVRIRAQYGHDAGYLEGAKISWADNERGKGPTGTAIRTGTPQVNQDFAHNPRMAPWRAEALKRGYASSIALPLGNQAGIFGALTIYASEPYAFDTEEVKLLVELASDLSYGITTLLTRAERDLAMIERQRYAEKVKATLSQTIQAIAAVVEMRDPYTAGHEARVAILAAAIAKEMGLSAEQIESLYLAASVHDLGKIHVPAEILSKPGGLSKIERELVEVHAEAGYDILRGIDFPWPVAQMVLQHHERLDGSGYPKNLRGENILLEAQILAVADVVEAMASHRPYRPALGTNTALAHITENRGKLYNHEAVDICVKLFKEQGFAFQT